MAIRSVGPDQGREQFSLVDDAEVKAPQNDPLSPTQEKRDGDEQDPQP